MKKDKRKFWTAIIDFDGETIIRKRHSTLEDALSYTGKALIKDDVVEVIILQEVGIYHNLGVEMREQEAEK